jgi:hypothetical protein
MRPAFKSLGLFIVAGVLAGALVASALFARSPAVATEPTRAPVPTFTPTPPGGIDYPVAATAAQQTLAQALTEIGRLIQSPQLADAAWTDQVETAKPPDNSP